MQPRRSVAVSGQHTATERRWLQPNLKCSDRPVRPGEPSPARGPRLSPLGRRGILPVAGMKSLTGTEKGLFLITEILTNDLGFVLSTFHRVFSRIASQGLYAVGRLGIRLRLPPAAIRPGAHRLRVSIPPSALRPSTQTDRSHENPPLHPPASSYPRPRPVDSGCRPQPPCPDAVQRQLREPHPRRRGRCRRQRGQLDDDRRGLPLDQWLWRRHHDLRQPVGVSYPRWHRRADAHRHGDPRQRLHPLPGGGRCLRKHRRPVDPEGFGGCHGQPDVCRPAEPQSHGRVAPRNLQPGLHADGGRDRDRHPRQRFHRRRLPRPGQRGRRPPSRPPGRCWAWAWGHSA